MANRHRAEAEILIEGRPCRLRLTLQALAEIERAFGVNGIEALGQRLSAGGLGAGDLVTLLGALLRAGGTDIADGALAGRIEARDLPAILTAISAVFEASFDGPNAAAMTPNPPAPQRAGEAMRPSPGRT